MSSKNIYLEFDMALGLNKEQEEVLQRLKNDIASLTIDINGDTSDGYHTFNELYHHRAVLFSVIVSHYPELSWKSKHHNDGSMFDDMFIVGINTPQGQATYHYDINPYWDMFDCKELDKAPVWDGHTPDEAICRIESLKKLVH